MRRAIAGLRLRYGAGPLHLLVVTASFALLAYVVFVLGLSALWDGTVWWQTILVWFVGAVVLHDLVLFPAYALADRLLTSARRRARGSRRSVSPTNYVRVPLLTTGLLFLMFFPGIVSQGASSYLSATGQTQEPFLARWLWLSVAAFVLSGLAYAVRLGVRRRSR